MEFGKKEIPLSAQIKLDVFRMDASSKVQFKAKFEFKSNDGAKGDFTLLSNVSDKGYIEVKKEPVEDEPAPDNDGE